MPLMPSELPNNGHEAQVSVTAWWMSQEQSWILLTHWTP
jgi:hypothetical protein